MMIGGHRGSVVAVGSVAFHVVEALVVDLVAAHLIPAEDHRSGHDRLLAEAEVNFALCFVYCLLQFFFETIKFNSTVNTTFAVTAVFQVNLGLFLHLSWKRNLGMAYVGPGAVSEW